MDKEQFYKEFFRYLECGCCAELEFCQKQLEPACKTGLAIYRKLKLEDLEKEIDQLKQQLVESVENNKLLETQLQDMGRSKLSWENQYFTLYNTLKNYREVNEKKHLLNDKEWQDYCAYKIIEPQIKGCLDRERAYLNFFENFETNVNLIIAHNPRLDKCGIVKEIIYYVNRQIAELKGEK